MSEIHHLDIASTQAQDAGCGCGCGTHSETATNTTDAATTSTTGFTTSFQVVGMTCGHCVGAVTSELTESVAGVSNVDIDLPTGQVVLTSSGPVTEAAVAAAVTEAGYQLAPGSLH